MTDRPRADNHQPHQPTKCCTLSDREAEIVRLLTAGYRVPQIAGRLYLSSSTVRNHLSSMFRKLGVNSQQALILLFFELWRHPDTSPAGGLCAACRTPMWVEVT